MQKKNKIAIQITSQTETKKQKEKIIKKKQTNKALHTPN